MSASFSVSSAFVHVSSRPCPLSGTREAFVVARRSREGHPLLNLLNAQSGLVMVDAPVIDPATFYRRHYRQCYKGVAAPRLKHVRRAGRLALRRWARLERAGLAEGPVLEVGCGGGEFLFLLRRLGLVAEGVEPGEGYARHAAERLGLRVHNACLADGTWEEGSFGWVSLFHVLEHLAAPVEELRRLGSLVRPGGQVVVEVPNIVHAGMRFRDKWHVGHLYGFTVETLAATLRRAGLEVAGCSVVDGGANLWAVGRRPVGGGGTPGPEECRPEHAAEVRRQLAEQARRYYSRPETYRRFARRLVERAVESWRVARGPQEPRALLEALMAGARPAVGRAVPVG